MPIFELACPTCKVVEDVFLTRWDLPNPDCPVCGDSRERMMSRFGVVFTGPLTSKYNDGKKENAHQEGFWAYRKRSSLSGNPEPVFIETFDQLRAFNKAEGLADPSEVPTNATISKDGKTIKSDGMPGQWRGALPEVPSRVWEMTKSLTALNGNDPAPNPSGPPVAGQAVSASLMEKFAAEAGTS